MVRRDFSRPVPETFEMVDGCGGAGCADGWSRLTSRLRMRTQRRCHYRRLVETADMLLGEILSRNFLPHAPAAKNSEPFCSQNTVKSFTDMTSGEL
jgi:hypothetical protein